MATIPLSDDATQHICSSILIEILDDVFDPANDIMDTETDFPDIPTSPVSHTLLSSFRDSPDPLILTECDWSIQDPHFPSPDEQEGEIDTPEPPDVTLLQLSVLQQHVNYVCGYHALYNCWTIVQATRHDDFSIVPQFTFNRIQFWFVIPFLLTFLGRWWMSRLVQRLLAEQTLRGSECYPWEASNIRRGLLERCYIRYLLPSFPHIYPIPDVSRQLLENCFLTPEEIRRIDGIFDEILNSPSCQKGLLVSCVNHWFSLVINKRSPTSFEFYYLDSRNWEVFNRTDEEIRQSVETSILQFYTYLVDEHLQAHVKRYLDSVLDAKFTTKLLVRLCIGEIRFISLVLESGMNGLMRTHLEVAEGDIDEMLSSYFPPPMIRQGILRLLNLFEDELPRLNKKVVEGFREWLGRCKGEIEGKLDESEKERVELGFVDEEIEKIQNRIKSNRERMLVILDELEERLESCDGGDDVLEGVENEESES